MWLRSDDQPKVHYIHLYHHILWTPLFDLLRSDPYAGRIELSGWRHLM